jgi:hypothetical protein
MAVRTPPRSRSLCLRPWDLEFYTRPAAGVSAIVTCFRMMVQDFSENLAGSLFGILAPQLIAFFEGNSTVPNTIAGGSDLTADASGVALVGLGACLGAVHALAAPDHVAAVLAVSAGGGWRAGQLGGLWGVGQAGGLGVTLVVLIAAGGRLGALAGVDWVVDLCGGVLIVGLGLLMLVRAILVAW